MLIFTLIPIGIVWIKKFDFLKKNIKIVALVVSFGILFQISYSLAESWGSWFFTKEKILNIWFLNSPIEDLIFNILISIAISSAVLTFIYCQEKGEFDKWFMKFK